MRQNISLTFIAYILFLLVLLVIGIIVISQQGKTGTEDIDEQKIFHTFSSNVTLRYYTYEEMTEEADLIVRGKIIKIDESKWSTPGGETPKGLKITDSKKKNEQGEKIYYWDFVLEWNEIIYTDMTFEIEKYYKGDASDEIIIRTRDGTTGKYPYRFQMINNGDLNLEDFKEGEEYIFFLMGDTGYFMNEIGPQHYYVMTPRGKLSFSDGTWTNHQGDKVELKNFIENIE
jgi:hypothetical protein